LQHADACTWYGSSGDSWKPRTNSLAYSPLWYGSSDGTSMFLPHLGSLARFTTGAQNVE
jgi:hypothetical protein